jgi:azurin
MTRLIYLSLILSLLGWACGTDHSDAGGEEANDSLAVQPPLLDDFDGTQFRLTGNDLLRYDQELLTTHGQQMLRLTLTHVGELPAYSMGHNWVLLKPGTSIDDFAIEALDYKNNGFLPAETGDRVLAHTEMVGGGQSTTIEFPAPPPGTYDYICTFPNHYGFMNGQLVITAAPEKPAAPAGNP